MPTADLRARVGPLVRLAKRFVRVVGGRPLVALRRRALRPELTVVMPVYNVEAYLREALDSALTQSLHRLELIAVDDGSTDGSLAILRAYERRDPRVRVFSQANAGQGIARNVGVGHARAEFLTFMDSDDTIPPTAFEHMVATLRRSGSDFAVGGVRRFRHRRYQRTTWQRTVHQVERLGTTIDEFPAAMQDIIACNRVFRTTFWRDRIGDFRGKIAYEDHVPMLAAYVRAERFDVLSEVTYNWRIREDNTSTGQQKANLQNLLDRIEVKEEAHQLLLAEASAFVHQVWVARCLEVDFSPFVAQALGADETYRETLSATYRTFAERATEQAWDLVRVFPKVRAHLVAEGRWDDVDLATQYFRSVHQVPPTRVAGGVLLAVLPAGAAWATGLPAHLLRMAPLESHFEGAVEQLAWAGTDAVVTGWMRHRGLDVTEATPAMTLELRSGGTSIPLAVEHVRAPQANLWAPLPYAGCADAGFRATVPIDRLVAAHPSGGEPWHLHGSITGDGLTSAGTFHYPITGSSAEHPRAREVGLATGTVGVRPSWDSALGFCFRLRPGGLKHPPRPHSGPVVTDVRISSTDISVHVRGATPDALGDATLANPRTTLDLLDVTPSGEELVLRFSALASAFGAEPRTAPSGDYALRIGSGEAQPFEDFGDRLPVRLSGSAFGLVVAAGRRSPLQISLTPPFGDDEIGRYHQFRLQGAYRSSAAPLREAILLSSYLGEFCTDSQLAIDRHLARTRPELERIWGVADSSTPVPDGARSVLVDSAAWYDAVATSRYLCKNIDFGGWYRTRPGQAYLQTFHGYPFKTMGLDFWRSKAWSPGEIRHAVAKVNAEWDLILVPSAECEAYYREQFSYAGPVLVAGYPRTDVLVNADAARVRSEVLARIGVPEDRTVVLYAPTYRDTLTTKLYAASRFDELDLAELTDRLGPGYVVLVRGHNNNQRDSERVPRAGSVLDVTDYPDINELTLAADVAVLDYSSLRFDWAITGKPMVFFVPDMESYFDLRPPLFGFEESAPGPLVTTTARVADALGDLDGLRSAHGPAIAAFNERFNGLHDGRATERVLAALLDQSTPWRTG